MAVIAYASADAAPKTNPYVDLEFDLSAVTLPQVGNLYGDAYDSADPLNSSWDWSWTILDNDSGAPAVLSSATVRNPNLTVNIWRNVRLFLIVTNTTTSETSETDPLKAPDSAFVVARILSVSAGVQKFARGERNWTEEIHDWATAIEAGSGAGVASHAIIDHSDVTSATGAELEILRGGGYVESGGSPLHIHKGDNVDVATTSTPGVVYLEEAAAAAGSPKVITQERITLQAHVDVSRVASMGVVLGILPRAYPSNDLITSGGPLAMWRVEEAVTVEGLAISLSDGGSAGATNAYRFALVVATAANAALLTWSIIAGLSTPTGAPATDGAPLLLSATAGAPIPVTAGYYLALLCLQAPRVSDGDQYGGGLDVQVYCRRRV